MNELDIIQKFFLPLTKNNIFSQGLLDDVAFIKAGKNQKIVISSDFLLEGKHITSNTRPKFMANKLLGRNLADILCKGAKPLCYSLNIMLASSLQDGFFEDFTSGLKEFQDIYDMFLLGGDICVSGFDKNVFCVTIFGTKEDGDSFPSRGGAKCGDLICVSGLLGKAYIGYKSLIKDLANDKHKQFEKFYLSPMPNYNMFVGIARFANATMDISDGVFQDVLKIAKASGVDVEIDFDKIKCPDLYSLQKVDAITFGDDYEILFTIEESKLSNVEAICGDVIVIGRCTGSSLNPSLKINNGPSNISSLGYDHFKGL